MLCDRGTLLYHQQRNSHKGITKLRCQKKNNFSKGFLIATDKGDTFYCYLLSDKSVDTTTNITTGSKIQ